MVTNAMAYNLINQDPIKSYLAGFATGAGFGREELIKLLEIALLKPLSKEVAYLEEIAEFPKKPPAWLTRDKWHSQGPWFEFKPDKELEDKVRHVKDWIVGAQSECAEWLSKLDEKGRPQKLVKIGTLQQALDIADKEMERAAQKLRESMRGEMGSVVEDTKHMKVIKRFKDGFAIVQLLTPQALDAETAQLGHCIGNGGYDSALHGSARFYSLRDEQNRAHATIEVKSENNAIVQCKGKRNAPPVRKYQPYIQEFAKDEDFAIKGDVNNIGMVKFRGRYYFFNKLPSGMVFDGRLDLSNFTEDVKLPNRLKIKGNLILNGARKTEIPEGVVLAKSEHCVIDVWKRKGKYHREDGPAYVVKTSSGKRVLEEKYYKNGVLHREDGPAMITYSASGEVTSEGWYINGKEHRTDGPAFWRNSWRDSFKSWYQHGVPFHEDPDHPTRIAQKSISLSRGYGRSDKWSEESRCYLDRYFPTEETRYNVDVLISSFENKKGEHRIGGMPSKIVTHAETGGVLALQWHRNGDLQAEGWQGASPLTSKFNHFAQNHPDMARYLMDDFVRVATGYENKKEEAPYLADTKVARRLASLARKHDFLADSVMPFFKESAKFCVDREEWDLAAYVTKQLKTYAVPANPSL